MYLKNKIKGNGVSSGSANRNSDCYFAFRLLLQVNPVVIIQVPLPFPSIVEKAGDFHHCSLNRIFVRANSAIEMR